MTTRRSDDFDHFADAPALARMHNAPMYGPAGMNQTIATYGILPAELAPRFGKGGTILPWGPTGPKIIAVRAEHSSELAHKDAAGKDIVLPGGEPVGFIIELENGLKVWHMGDTGVFGDMRLIGEMYRPDVVLMPIGNHFVMSPQDAAMAVRDMIRPRYAIVSPTVRRQWQAEVAELLPQPGFREAFAPRGEAPGIGELFICPGQADTLQRIAVSKSDARPSKACARGHHQGGAAFRDRIRLGAAGAEDTAWLRRRFRPPKGRVPCRLLSSPDPQR